MYRIGTRTKDFLLDWSGNKNDFDPVPPCSIGTELIQEHQHSLEETHQFRQQKENQKHRANNQAQPKNA